MSVFIFGLGYVGQHFMNLLQSKGIQVGGTTRDKAKQQAFKEQGVETLGFPFHPHDLSILNAYDSFVITIPPNGLGDPVFNFYRGYFESRTQPIKWICYISSTTVYGDYKGEWVTEDSLLLGKNERDKNRILAEKQWLKLFEYGEPQYSPAPVIHLIRLAGIYGPGRSIFDRFKQNRTPPIRKDDLVFSRIHIDDISNLLLKSMEWAQANGTDRVQKDVFNGADDHPTSPEEVDNYARTLLGWPLVEPIPYSEGQISSRMLEFYNASKKASNEKMKSILDIKLKYPSFQDGLKDLVNLTTF